MLRTAAGFHRSTLGLTARDTEDAGCGIGADPQP